MMRAVRLLAIESSSPRLSLALSNGRAVVARFAGEREWRHAESLFDGLKAMMKQVRWTPNSLTGVAVSVGPGSFTGIRIGLAAARALGQTLSIPVVGVSSLETLAADAPTDTRWVFAMVDALRGALFGALYERSSRGALKCRTIGKRLELAEWARILRRYAKGETVWLAGDSKILRETSFYKPFRYGSSGEAFPRADRLLQCAASLWATAGPTSYRKVLPLYLRDAAAVERRKR